MEIRELMQAPVQTLTLDDTLNCAAKLMSDQSIGCIPIVDQRGTLIGILTDRDIALAAYETGEALWQLPIRASMHEDVHTCRAEDDIATVAQTMRAHRVRRLPVVDAASKPLGMISIDDLTHASREPIMDPTPGLTCDEIGGLYEATSGRSKHAREVHE
jgi:CBS domain-containing protein